LFTWIKRGQKNRYKRNFFGFFFVIRKGVKSYPKEVSHLTKKKDPFVIHLFLIYYIYIYYIKNKWRYFLIKYEAFGKTFNPFPGHKKKKNLKKFYLPFVLLSFDLWNQKFTLELSIVMLLSGSKISNIL
jgi:hypothetical protein